MKPTRVAIYARVSTRDQTTENQIIDLRHYAKQRGWQIAAEYIDEGFSGAKSSRPRLDDMMIDARRRKFDAVLVFRFDRFARSTAHLLAALDEFRVLGIDFVSTHEAVDTTTPLGRMVFTVVAAVAELERSIIVERINAGLARAVAKGKKLGRPRGSQIDEKEIRRCLNAGMSTRAVARSMGIGLGSVHRARKQATQKSCPEIGIVFAGESQPKK